VVVFGQVFFRRAGIFRQKRAGRGHTAGEIVWFVVIAASGAAGPLANTSGPAALSLAMPYFGVLPAVLVVRGARGALGLGAGWSQRSSSSARGALTRTDSMPFSAEALLS